MNLFIDTNIFLSFYHFSSDDLGELKKLVGEVRKGSVQLLLPHQVEMEFSRNRDNKIADALKGLKELKLHVAYPPLCKDYKEYNWTLTNQAG